MTSNTKQYSLGCRFCLTIIVFCICVFPWCCSCKSAARSQFDKQLGLKQKVPAFFAFGDSLMDPGNNNQLFTILRCDFPPYGKDFADHKPTGRFSNGRIIPDFMAEELGIKMNMPAYLDPSLMEDDLLTGVSFASSGSGCDPLTCQLLFVKSPEEQLEMFKEYIERVKGMVGVEITNFILKNSISMIVEGNNDLANTYFYTPFRITQYDVDSYTDFLVNIAISNIKELYKLGVRKIGVGNVVPIGCLPLQRTLAGGLWRECPNHLNEAAKLYNSKLKDEVLSLSSELSDAKLVYIDLYSIMLELISNNTRYGFEVVDKGCCGSGLVELAVLCNPFSSVCEDDNKYLFWDGYHPSEKANRIIVRHIFDKYIPLFF